MIIRTDDGKGIVDLDLTASNVLYTPVATPTPLPPAPVPPNQTLLGLKPNLQNMVESNGVYSSIGTKGVIGVLQYKLPQPASWISLTCLRQTNVIVNTSGGGINQKINLKEWRSWPDETYPNLWVGIGPGNGAYKLGTEVGIPPNVVGKTADWFTIARVADTWTREYWEFDFVKSYARIDIGEMSWKGNFDPGVKNQTGFGVQCVIANDPGQSYKPYVNFKEVAFLWRP